MKKAFKVLKDFCVKNPIYVITILISIVLTIPFMIWGTNVLSVLSGIGCSGIAAAIIAIFIDAKIDKDRKKKIEKAKEVYFKKLYDELVMMLQRILWFEKRLPEDDFDWNMPPEAYSTISYMLFSSKFPNENISFEEATKRLEDCSKKYGLESMKLLSDKEKGKIVKMFRIVAASGDYLKMHLETIKKNEIALNVEEYLSFEDINTLTFNINLALTLMEKTNKNYGAAINSLVSSVKKLRETCGYQNEFVIALQGSFPMKDI